LTPRPSLGTVDVLTGNPVSWELALVTAGEIASYELVVVALALTYFLRNWLRHRLLGQLCAGSHYVSMSP
jgi:hypothetical protein